MPTSLDDLDENDEQGGEDAKGLRKQLEAVLAQNRTLTIEKVLREHELPLVKAEDLAGVKDLDKIEERAKAIQTERVQLQETLVRDIFRRKGIEGDDLEAMVKEFVGTQPPTADEDAEALERARALRSSTSGPAPLVNPENVHGRDAIAMGVKV